MMSEALKLVPPQWQDEFRRFVEQGEASRPFLDFLERDRGCRRACEMVLRADEETRRIIATAMQDSTGLSPAVSVVRRRRTV